MSQGGKKGKKLTKKWAKESVRLQSTLKLIYTIAKSDIA